jgi:hypothetical protein
VPHILKSEKPWDVNILPWGISVPVHTVVEVMKEVQAKEERKDRIDEPTTKSDQNGMNMGQNGTGKPTQNNETDPDHSENVVIAHISGEANRVIEFPLPGDSSELVHGRSIPKGLLFPVLRMTSTIDFLKPLF